MDLLMRLSEVKAKAITYVRNNFKIRKIVAIQTKKESIMKTVERVKSKLIRWRKFTRTTLADEDRLKRMKDQAKGMATKEAIDQDELDPLEPQSGIPKIEEGTKDFIGQWKERREIIREKLEAAN
jgi:hypothetical protein